MANDPAVPGDDGPDEEPDNPFKGTPFEQIFSAFGGSGGTMPDLSQLMSQMQAMMTPHEGSVNWDLAKDVARRTVDLAPAVLLAMQLLMGALFGILGVLFADPILATLKVVLVDLSKREAVKEGEGPEVVSSG